MGRCGGAGGKGANNEKGKGHGKGSGKNQDQTPQGKGRGFGFIPKWSKPSQSNGRGFGASSGAAGGGESPAVMMKINKLVQVMSKMEAKFAKLGVSSTASSPHPKREPEAQKDTWTCSHCKAERCFATRVECYKCGEPRTPNPPGLGANAAAVNQGGKVEAAAVPREVEVIEEVTLEETIAEVEENLKLLRGKESVWAKSQKQGLEGQLKELKEQQRLARPLPARLQAATDRVAKSGIAVKASETEVATICEALKAARKQLEDNQEKHLVALQEMEAVKQVAGAEPIEEAVKGLAAGMRQALATRNILGADAEAIMQIAEQLYLNHKAGGGAAAPSPVQPPGVSSRPAGPQGSGPSLTQRLAAVRGERTGRGRSPERVRVPRSKSTSRSPKGRQEEY